MGRPLTARRALDVTAAAGAWRWIPARGPAPPLLEDAVTRPWKSPTAGNACLGRAPVGYPGFAGRFQYEPAIAGYEPAIAVIKRNLPFLEGYKRRVESLLMK